MKANKISYSFKSDRYIHYTTDREQIALEVDKIREALHFTNKTISKIANFEVDIFNVLGMRNLSAFIGELFVASMVKTNGSYFRKNPHQDGYPDLLAMTKVGKKEWERLINNLQDKKPFSPFKTGGIEIKATCGSVPTPKQLQNKGLKKPEIGESRIKVVRGYDWKSHHRETNNLMGIFWDFINGSPRIIALFYCQELSKEDWGKIIKPKESGGRTTSVSIMTRVGVHKMYKNWIAVIKDNRYIDFLNLYNKDNIIPQV